MQTHRLHVALLGDSTVGKTALCTALVSGNAQKLYSMTLGAEHHVKSIRVPDTDVSIELHIVDTGGHPIYSKLRPQFAAGSQLLCFVYDVTSRSSFQTVQLLLREALNTFMIEKIPEGRPDPNRPIGVLVANKSDLRDYSQVSVSEAQEFAIANGLAFFETSAITNDNVVVPFAFLADLYYRTQQ